MNCQILFVFVFFAMVILQGEAILNPRPRGEDYASYATLYPEIAKKIGEEPIDIIDVVKAVLVYDSDDAASTPQTLEMETELIDSRAETLDRYKKRSQ